LLAISVQIVRYVDDSQPGWVECQFTDMHGRQWSFIEKVPVVSETWLGSSSAYPQPGAIACEVIEWFGEVIRVDTSRSRVKHYSRCHRTPW
jgi:hypothetical protein